MPSVTVRTDTLSASLKKCVGFYEKSCRNAQEAENHKISKGDKARDTDSRCDRADKELYQ